MPHQILSIIMLIVIKLFLFDKCNSYFKDFFSLKQQVCILEQLLTRKLVNSEKDRHWKAKKNMGLSK